MRSVILVSTFACLLCLAAPAHRAVAAATPIPSMAAAPVVALQIPDKKIEITIGDHDAPWYRNPVWIAIGILAVVVIVLLALLISRGGGTTIVRH